MKTEITVEKAKNGFIISNVATGVNHNREGRIGHYFGRFVTCF